MRFGRVLVGVLLVLLLIAIVAGVGWSAFNAGLMQGMVASGAQTLPADGGTVPVTPSTVPWHFGPWGVRAVGFGWGFHPFAFGLFGCLVPVLFLFLIFALFRLAFGGPRYWGGPWSRGGTGWDSSQGDIPPAVRDMHRKLHEMDATNPPAAPTGAQ